jgi:hypothetical protein
MKELHTKNLLVPVVGNFAGPKAIRSVGRTKNAMRPSRRSTRRMSSSI